MSICVSQYEDTVKWVVMHLTSFIEILLGILGV